MSHPAARARQPATETYHAAQGGISPELAVTSFQLLSGLGGGLAALLAANRLSAVDGTIGPAQLAVPVGLSIAGTVAGALTLPGEFTVPSLSSRSPRTSTMSATDTFRRRSTLNHCAACERRSQRITSHATAFRDRSTIAGAQISESPISLKDGNLFLSEADVPDDDVDAGGTVDVGWAVANGAVLFDGTDPDTCVNDANPCTTVPDPLGGYCYEFEVRPSWIEADPQFAGPRCIPASEVGSTEQREQWTFDAPPTLDGGLQEEELQFILTAPGSTEFGVFSLPVTFRDGASSRPGTGEKEVDVDTTGNGGGGGGGGGGDLGDVTVFLVLVIVLVAVLAVVG